MDSTLARYLALIAALLVLEARALNHDTTVAPLSPGKFAVACSNIEQDESRIAAGALPADYWEGKQVQGRDTYVTDLLSQPGSVVRYDAPVPDVRRLYPGHAGGTVPFVAIVCFPTTATNTDPGYKLPGSTDIVPHMQPAGTAPKLVSGAEYYQTLGLSGTAPAGPMRLPLLISSHGLGGSPIGPGYLDVTKQLAAQGFMVAAVFHADARFSRVRVEDLNDLTYLLFNFSRVIEMELLRPVALKSLVDTMLAHPAFGTAIDPDRIGGFGASLGGQAMINLLGARTTTSLDLNCDDTVRDVRIKAAMVYVPYAGQTYLPAFCGAQAGAAEVTRPVLAMSGTADTTAPSRMMEQALNLFRSSRYFVELVDGEHELRPQDAGDVLTWMVIFLNAYLDVRSDPTAMARLIKMQGVVGGRQDNLLVDVHVPVRNLGNDTAALEFYNTRLDHYFVAAGPDEVVNLLTGLGGPGWELTGQSFRVWLADPLDTSLATSPVCRFYGGLNGGPNSHFFTAESSECELVKRSPGWAYEGIGFHMRRVGSNGRCPAGMLELNRAYNNRFAQNDSNHRFSTSDSTMREMARKGWTVEGTVMCARP